MRYIFFLSILLFRFASQNAKKINKKKKIQSLKKFKKYEIERIENRVLCV